MPTAWQVLPVSISPCTSALWMRMAHFGSRRMEVRVGMAATEAMASKVVDIDLSAQASSMEAVAALLPEEKVGAPAPAALGVEPQR